MPQQDADMRLCDFYADAIEDCYAFKEIELPWSHKVVDETWRLSHAMSKAGVGLFLEMCPDVEQAAKAFASIGCHRAATRLRELGEALPLDIGEADDWTSLLKEILAPTVTAPHLAKFIRDNDAEFYTLREDQRENTAPDEDTKLCDRAANSVIERCRIGMPLSVLPQPHRTVLLTWQTTGIIENGGFEYLLANPHKEDPTFSYICQSFELIGCGECSDAIRKAIEVTKSEVIGDGDNPQLEKLNTVLWEAARGRITVKLADYIRKNWQAMASIVMTED
jgi:hypothetical protein